jgi:hypothetical protein
VNRRKPRVQTPVVSRYPAPAPIDNFVLLFLPPCGSHLTPLATGSLHYSEAPQGIDLSRPLFTCTNTNQAATCTCNTQPRVSPHHVVNHSSQLGATIHRSSDALVFNFAGCRLDRKSTSGTFQFLGSSLVSWSSREQSSVPQSTIEAEYVAASSCFSQLLWITYTMSDFGEEYTHVLLQCDNTSAISVAKNPVLHSKTKDIEVRYHFLRDNVGKGKIALFHVHTHDQLADIFTKPLDQATFTRLQGELGVCLIS